MTENKDDTGKALAFSGKITAGVTHEINNVMAIVRELSGLIDDMVYGAEQSGNLDQEKLKSISEKIAFQTKRGEMIIKRLNRFAHSSDVPLKKFSLREILQDTVDLSVRFANLRSINIQTDFPEYDVEMNSYPFRLYQAVFQCIEYFLQSCGEYGKILLKYESSDKSLRLMVTGSGLENGDKHINEINDITSLTQELGGKLSTSDEEDSKTIELFFSEI